jgi:hypothetical protein
VFDQREELPLLPFGNPIGYVPASRGGVYTELNYIDHGGSNLVVDQREELPLLPPVE